MLGGGGGELFAVFMTGGETELYKVNPPKIHEPQILYTQKMIWCLN